MTSSGAQKIDVSAGGNGTAISADNITVATNCKAGYSFSMATSVSNNNLYLDGSIANDASGTYFSPVDGTSALSSTNNKNKWGYYYNSSTPTTAPNASSVFSAVPVISSPATVVSPTSSATDINDSFNIYYGVAVSSNLIPGTYKMIPDANNSNNDGVIIYYLTLAEACMPYLVQFNPTSTAGGTTLSGTGTMAAQTIPAGTPTNLNANTFTAPSGYEFDGWNTAQDGTGTSYTDGQSVTDLTTGGGSITLYAQWKLPPIAMQDATMADCGKTMIDNRGVTTYRDVAYTTAKIGSLCWMTRNLDLPGGTTLTPADSNVTSNYILPASSADGFSDNSTAYVYNSDSTNFNDTSCGDNNPCYSYYSWVAATAGTNPSSGEASSDICPKGWRLPTEAEFNTLRGTYTTGATLTASPFLGVYAGYYSNSTLEGGGKYGYCWSSAARSAGYAYYLGFYSSNAGIDNISKYSGQSVRCVKDSDGYMQDFVLANAEDDVEYTLVDKRDNNTYTVKKINGQLWMTQNLRYLGDTGSAAGTMTIGNSNSNVTNKSITLYSLNSSNAGNFGAYKDHCDSSNGYDYACVYDSGSTSTGVWYNYYAASAGIIGGSSNSTAATSDICPAGWHLPSGPSTTANRDYNKLVGNTKSGYQAATSGLTAFSAVARGYYNVGSLSSGSTGYGYWWSATASNTTYRYNLGYNSRNGQFVGNGNGYRYSGYFVRCVRSS